MMKARERPARTGLWVGMDAASVEEQVPLLQRRIDVGEFGVQVGAETVDDSDDGKRNAGGDQPVFDRGSPGFVGEKIQKPALQVDLRCACDAYFQRPQRYRPRTKGR